MLKAEVSRLGGTPKDGWELLNHLETLQAGNKPQPLTGPQSLLLKMELLARKGDLTAIAAGENERFYLRPLDGSGWGQNGLLFWCRGSDGKQHIVESMQISGTSPAGSGDWIYTYAVAFPIGADAGEVEIGFVEREEIRVDFYLETSPPDRALYEPFFGLTDKAK